MTILAVGQQNRPLVPTGTNKTSIVLWTGHRTTSPAGGTSDSDADSHSVIMTPANTWWETSVGNYDNPNNTERFERRTRTLLHELSHQFGTVDHYCLDINSKGCSNLNCDRCYKNNGQIRQCIMSSPDEMIDITAFSDEELYCSECYTIIRNYLNSNVKF